MAVRRTFGWVQNPADLTKLKRVAGIFEHGSVHHTWLTEERPPLLLQYELISYGLLKGDRRRKSFVHCGRDQKREPDI